MITAGQIDLVKKSFNRVRPIADIAGMMLCERIFELAPEARALFPEDLRPHVKRLMSAVRVAVDNLDHLEEVAPFLIRLGARHADYGVVPEHFDIVGEALLWTLEQGLGDLFTPEVRDAWSAAWHVLAETMLTGVRSAAGDDETLLSA